MDMAYFSAFAALEASKGGSCEFAPSRVDRTAAMTVAG
jgi:hypothetical protein